MYRNQRTAPNLTVLLLTGVLGTAVALAAPPINGLPVPFYSFDRQSPTVLGGFFDARDVLRFDFPQPAVALPGTLLGLVQPTDELDALSSSSPELLDPLARFVLLFSVDRQTIGVTPPEPSLVAANVPYNVLDQAARGHAAGDQYASLTSFLREGGTEGGPIEEAPNNTLVLNNYDEGGRSFSAEPQRSAGQSSSAREGMEQDNVDAFARLPRHPSTNQLVKIYYSASSDSPSLLFLPFVGAPSGANIYFSANPTAGSQPQLYAPFFALGLQPADDVDALLVVDQNENGVFDGLDTVIFSLTPESPSALTIPGTTSICPGADVLIARPDWPPLVLAPAPQLGLGAPGDNIDALDYTLCNTPITCATIYGIRNKLGDMNCDGSVNFKDIDPFVSALGGPMVYNAAHPFCLWTNADANLDGNVTFRDIDPFVALLGTE